MEEWRDYSETTQISNHGRARQRPRVVIEKHKSGGTCKKYKKPTIRKTCPAAKSHLVLPVDGKTVRLCDLVAEVWIGPRPEGHQVVHIDGNKRNNKPDNLKYKPV